MPNLPKNIKCPNCAAKHLFKLEVSASAEMSETQIGNITDIKWAPESPIICKVCYQAGTLEEFTVKRGSRKKGVN
jgi:hypothetical protein